jgi:hypothetical protein
VGARQESLVGCVRQASWACSGAADAAQQLEADRRCPPPLHHRRRGKAAAYPVAGWCSRAPRGARPGAGRAPLPQRRSAKVGGRARLQSSAPSRCCGCRHCRPPHGPGQPASQPAGRPPAPPAPAAHRVLLEALVHVLDVSVRPARQLRRHLRPAHLAVQPLRLLAVLEQHVHLGGGGKAGGLSWAGVPGGRVGQVARDGPGDAARAGWSWGEGCAGARCSHISPRLPAPLRRHQQTTISRAVVAARAERPHPPRPCSRPASCAARA